MECHVLDCDNLVRSNQRYSEHFGILCSRCNQRRTRYDLTVPQFLALFDKGMLCNICSVPITHGNYGFAVDHDHESGEARGLLCRNCNIGLGHLKDDVEILRRAIVYLEEHSGN